MERIPVNLSIEGSTMRQALFALALVLALAGCSKYEVLGRNIQYTTPQLFEEEKADVTARYQRVQADLAKAEASGDAERIKQARADFKEVEAQYKVIQEEARRRQRGW